MKSNKKRNRIYKILMCIFLIAIVLLSVSVAHAEPAVHEFVNFVEEPSHPPAKEIITAIINYAQVAMVFLGIVLLIYSIKNRVVLKRKIKTQLEDLESKNENGTQEVENKDVQDLKIKLNILQNKFILALFFGIVLFGAASILEIVQLLSGPKPII